ncbi:uncharacterized protein LOC129951990 [Eupeodes corollae]|uniref:uncharacterized protein LOC129951990 n=1 Tax=Eupeodes corollae TaxID=290404 RepID=UPI002490978F|nr:uncharacterized protein LOC129951990 [Eupeodes corollae]
MINGKFFTGLPANMVDRRPTQNRQESHFFWPDDTQNVSTVDSRTKRRASIQAENRNGYNNNTRGELSSSDAENKERFKKEFTRSSIQFYDKVDETPMSRNRQKVTTAPPPPPQKLQNVNPPENMLAKRKENLSSKIEFFDYAGAEDLNNVPKTDKNNKAELERNTKNSPKLQNKNLSFDQTPDEAINFIENDVRDMRISAPPRRRNTMRDSRPRYGRPLDPVDPLYSDIPDDYMQPRSRSRPLNPPPIRNRYPESDPDFEDYFPRRSNPRPPYYAREPLDYVDGHPSVRNNYYEGGGVVSKKLGRQSEFTYSSAHEYNSNYGDSPPPPPPSSASSSTQQRMPPRKAHILKVDNDIRNNEQRRMMMPPPPSSPSSTTTSHPPPSPSTSTPPKHHLRSNICFSDTESAPPAPARSSRGGPPPPAAAKRNIRSSAVNRVSVGLPD